MEMKKCASVHENFVKTEINKDLSYGDLTSTTRGDDYVSNTGDVMNMDESTMVSMVLQLEFDLIRKFRVLSFYDIKPSLDVLIDV